MSVSRRSHPCNVCRLPGGFTLIEVLVVVAIIVMLMALIAPAVVGSRARARQAECANNQRNVSQAILQYQGAKGFFPGYVNAWRDLGTPSNPLKMDVSWVVPVLESLGRKDLVQIWREGVPDSQGVVIEGAVRVAVLTCPSDAGPNPSPLSYVVNCGRPGADPLPRADGIFYDRSSTASTPVPSISLTDIHDGPGQTLMLAERLFDSFSGGGSSPALGQWTNWTEASVGFVWDLAPSKPELEASRIGIAVPEPWRPKDSPGAKPKTNPGITSNHIGGVNVSFCDGHQHFLSENVDYRVFQLLATPDSRAAQLEVQKELGGSGKGDKDFNVDGTGGNKLKEGDY